MLDIAENTSHAQTRPEDYAQKQGNHPEPTPTQRPRPWRAATRDTKTLTSRLIPRHARGGPHPEPAMIPAVIHQFWDGPPLPDHLRAYIDTWKHHHPQAEHKLWNDRAVRDLPLTNQDLYDNAEHLTNSNPWQLKSDIARYEILSRFGGIWADTDLECQHRLDPILNGLNLVIARESNNWATNALMACEPDHPAMKRLIAQLPASAKRHENQAATRISGPQFLTPRIKRFDPFLLPPAWCFPYSWNELERGTEHFPDAFTVHHWHNQRTKKGKPL